MRRKAGEAAAKQTGMQILWGAAESRRAVLPCMRRESRSCAGGAAGSAYSAAVGGADIPAAESHKVDAGHDHCNVILDQMLLFAFYMSTGS